MSKLWFLLVALLSQKKFSVARQQIIHGTSLITEKYYTWSMTTFPNTFAIWNKATSGQADYRYINLFQGQKHHSSIGRENVEWKFVSVANETEWFHIVNRGQPEQMVSWGKVRDFKGNHNTSYVLVIKVPADKSAQDHYLFRPVRPIVSVLPNRFQLQLKSFPNSTISWSNIEGMMYLKIEDLKNSTKQYYEYYSEPFKNTLITIDSNGGKIRAFASAEKCLVNLWIVFVLTVIGLLFSK